MSHHLNETKYTFSELWPDLYEELVEIGKILERKFQDVQDVEFVVERNRLFITNARRANRTPKANLRFNLQFFEEGKITLDEFLRRVSIVDIDAFLTPIIKNKKYLPLLGKGLPASQGISTGRIVLSIPFAQQLASKNDSFVIVCHELSPEDISETPSSFLSAIITKRGGMTSHAAVVCRGMGIPCVVGIQTLDIDYKNADLAFSKYGMLKEGDWITIDGSHGLAYKGRAKLETRNWWSVTELVLLNKLIGYAIFSDIAPSEVVGICWRIRDSFIHSIPTTIEPSGKKALSHEEYKSYREPKKSEVRKLKKELINVIENTENTSHIIVGLSNTLLRIMANTVGLGNHYLYFRTLWDPNRYIYILFEDEFNKNMVQLIGYEYFDINRYVPHLIDISDIRILLNIQLHSDSEAWFLDYSNPDGESLVANSENIIGYSIYINGAKISHSDLPQFYNIVRKREYCWTWYEYNKTSHEKIVDFLKTYRKKRCSNDKLYLNCTQLGLIQNGELTSAGLSLIGQRTWSRQI